MAGAFRAAPAATARLDVDLPRRDSSGRSGSGPHGILLSTVRAVADGRLAATALPYGELRVDGAAIAKAVAGCTGSVAGHLTDGRTFTGEVRIRP
ncbi:hypothetical protein [Nonomuraea sp. NPDC049625]|uniref:hypothetical protein n=1 Tax=Nonomuraea sp. NPDC049625 TaxID=3155775 RepID=UPI003445C47D